MGSEWSGESIVCRSIGSRGGEMQHDTHKLARMCIFHAILKRVIFFYELWFGTLGEDGEKALLTYTSTLGCEICALVSFSCEYLGRGLVKTVGA